jgi:GMP synthase-like glutamine amidotransferase
MSRCLTVANADLDRTGIVGDELERRGYRLELVLREGRLDWPSLDGIDLVLVLGSDWSVYGEPNRTEVDGEVALVREAHERGTPTFGICFGAQVLAAALGGTVRRSAVLELGWCTVESLDGAVPPGPWMQWHQDTFDVPSGVELLARSPAGPQAIRAVRSFAVQFHPEVDVAIVESWIEADAGRDLGRAGVDPAELLAATRRHVLEAEARTRALVHWFSTEVAR